MKLTPILCCLFLVFAASTQADSRPGAGGTLYLEDSIVGGLRIYWLFLADDGTFVKDPKFGVDPVHFDMEKQSNAANTGTYVQAGDKVSVTYTNGKTEQWAIGVLNGKLNTLDGLFISEQSPLPANFTLDGSFTANLDFGGVSSSQTYTFSSDGTLTMKGIGAVRSSAGGAVASSLKKGTYKITGNTLNIDLETGEHSVAVIGLLPGTKPSIIINGTLFK